MADDLLPRSASITIIGGGIVGLSIAFHLAERGTTDVVVLERAEIASGATSKATGGIRQQFSSETEVRLSLESVRFYEQFADRVGSPFLFRQIGYLFLVTDRDQHAAFARNAALQRRLGVPTDMLSSQDVAERYPAIDPKGLVGASFCPTDGVGPPADAAYGFARRARELGVRIVEGAGVTAVEVDHGAICGVRTATERLATEVVVNAAGPWAGMVGKLVGCSLPVRPYPRQAFTVSAVAELGPDFPFTIDMQTGVYVHQEPGSIVLGGGDRVRTSGFEAVLDWSRFDHVVDSATRRVPALAEARSISGWCGLREMTPDDHAIVGPLDDPRGFWNAVGFSGHGFMHAPAVGRLMAEWLLDGSPSGIDVEAFALERFDAPDVAEERLVF